MTLILLVPFRNLISKSAYQTGMGSQQVTKLEMWTTSDANSLYFRGLLHNYIYICHV